MENFSLRQRKSQPTQGYCRIPQQALHLPTLPPYPPLHQLPPATILLAATLQQLPKIAIAPHPLMTKLTLLTLQILTKANLKNLNYVD
jgi:hypothetical protein